MIRFIRFVFASLLILKVWVEAGPWTAFAIGLVGAGVEVNLWYAGRVAAEISIFRSAVSALAEDVYTTPSNDEPPS